jgi:hypothetical protein
VRDGRTSGFDQPETVYQGRGREQARERSPVTAFDEYHLAQQSTGK